MNPREWDRLMRQARAHAILHGHRVKVLSWRMSDLSATYFGTRWAYAIDCPATARDFMRSH